MMVSKEVLRKCNLDGEYRFDYEDTGQSFVLLTMERYRELTASTGSEVKHG